MPHPTGLSLANSDQQEWLDSDAPKYPSLVVVPATPPANFEASGPTYAADRDARRHSSDRHRDSEESDAFHLRPPSELSHEQAAQISSEAHAQILTALSIGAPIIAGVVGSCLSIVTTEFATVLSENPIQRPARASACIVLLWCSMLTSLGATMTAVAGLAMHAGYHDSHVGVTKKIVRMLREWKRSRKGLPRHGAVRERPGSPTPSAITSVHRSQHAAVAFRAAVVAARMLGVSVGLLGIGLAVYIFLLYPLSVAVIVVVAGVLTAVGAAAPMLPVLLESRS